jgi:hypothetical protein
MQKPPTIRCFVKVSAFCASAMPSKDDRRGWRNVPSGIAVNSDQSLNPLDRLRMLDAETFGVSGGTYAGLKPSLAL